MRGREAPMDLDMPRGYAPCWLDESPPKVDIDQKENSDPRKRTEETPVTQPAVNKTVTPSNSAKSQTRLRRSPFYTASPLGISSLRASKNNFLRRLRRSFGDKSSDEDEVFESKSTGYHKRKSRDFAPKTNTQYGGSHLYLPFVLMGYLQVLFNVAIVAGILYFFVQFALTIRRDVDLKVEEQLTNIMSDISQCSRQYIENKCSPELRVPAMEKACVEWENCMKRDPSTIGRAKLSAETFAEVINGLIDPISYKTMIFILLGVFGAMYLSNYAFSAVRHRTLSSSILAKRTQPPHVMTPVSPFSRHSLGHPSFQNVLPPPPT